MTGRDVTAVVRSRGESCVERALTGLARQTRPSVDAVRVDGVSPFHRAGNGVARVPTDLCPDGFAE